MSKPQGKLKKGVSIPSDASVSITCPCYLAFCCCCGRRAGGFRGAEGTSSCGAPTGSCPLRQARLQAAPEGPCEPAPRHSRSFGCGFLSPADTGEARCSRRGSGLTPRQLAPTRPAHMREGALLRFSPALDEHYVKGGETSSRQQDRSRRAGRKTEEVANHQLVPVRESFKAKRIDSVVRNGREREGKR